MIGDYITKCLWRYTNFWDYYFGKHTVNCGIGGDKVEDVVWSIGNVDANKEMRDFLICETNSINNNVPEDIVKGIKYVIQLIKRNFYNSLLGNPYSEHRGIQKDKIRLVKF